MWLNIHHRHLNPPKPAPKFYCRHCGHKTQRPSWEDIGFCRCPKCGASTPPKKW
jgi:Zn finger protein HypA/HybF involved in hydrogenase expression